MEDLILPLFSTTSILQGLHYPPPLPIRPLLEHVCVRLWSFYALKCTRVVASTWSSEVQPYDKMHTRRGLTSGCPHYWWMVGTVCVSVACRCVSSGGASVCIQSLSRGGQLVAEPLHCRARRRFHVKSRYRRDAQGLNPAPSDIIRGKIPGPYGKITLLYKW